MTKTLPQNSTKNHPKEAYSSEILEALNRVLGTI